VTTQALSIRPNDGNALKTRAQRLRMLIIRTHAAAGHGHLGSSLSLVEILTALFAAAIDTTGWDRPSPVGDRLVLSKGHAALALYCALAEAKLLPNEALAEFGRNGSMLEAHPNERLLPLVQASTGSLGQGLSIGLGLAHGSRMAGRAHEGVVVILGDGEMNEGQVWEAAIAAPKLGLGNLLALVDMNGLQQDGSMDEIMPVGDLAGAWAALGWSTYEVDGHDCGALAALLASLRGDGAVRPKLVIARTVKGCGVPFLENAIESHYPPPLDPGEIELMARLTAREAGHDA
jgi:transketolase